MQRPHYFIIACIVTASVLAAGCDRTSDRQAGERPAGSPTTQHESATPPASAPTSQNEAIRGVVDTYILEHTAEGAPYYIDSSATEFVGIEGEIRQEEDHAICFAKFASGRDVYYLRFVLSMETGRYVIRRVILDRLNDRKVRRTLYDRDTLVL